jgi:putative oxidoreductase
MFEQATSQDSRSALLDWALRGAVAAAFIVFGIDKFRGAEWVTLFRQIGLGQWFRYCTGVVEIVGGVLVLIPWTVTAGLALLACTMASAALILAFVIGHPGDMAIPLSFCVCLILFWLNRRGL